MIMKVGDRVERIVGVYEGMKIGDIDIVTKIEEEGYSVRLKKFGCGHAPSSLKLLGCVNSGIIVR